jgi:hypothetical protein
LETELFQKQNAVATHGNRVFVCELSQVGGILITAGNSSRHRLPVLPRGHEEKFDFSAVAGQIAAQLDFNRKYICGPAMVLV